MEQWYILYQGKQVGPMSADQLKSYGLRPNSMVWHEGLPEWKEALNYPELMEIISKNGGTPPSCPPPAYSTSATGKDHIVAGILAILLGGLGIHYFYIGKTTGGLICLALTLVTCGLWSIVPFVQGILILTQTQEQFEEKYVLSESKFPLF